MLPFAFSQDYVIQREDLLPLYNVQNLTATSSFLHLYGLPQKFLAMVFL